MSVLKEANATGRFWIGASDLENVGHFKWFYSGQTIPEVHWMRNGKPDDSEEAKKLDQVRKNFLCYIQQRFTHKKGQIPGFF